MVTVSVKDPVRAIGTAHTQEYDNGHCATFGCATAAETSGARRARGRIKERMLTKEWMGNSAHFLRRVEVRLRLEA
jgi:hypothetical protein